MRAGQLKIGRSLADLGTVQHQAQMFGFDVLTAGFQTMVHRGLQTNLVAQATRRYASLRGMF